MRFLRCGSAAASCLVIGLVVACSSNANHEDSALKSSGGTSALVSEPSANLAGGGSASSVKQRPKTVTGGGGGGAAASVDASEGGEAGAPARDPNATCTLDDTCVANCTTRTATCGVESFGAACEFEGLKGASAALSCGEHKVVGLACCGGCGCVPVEVYFDGWSCWQGLPQCSADQFANHMLDPHAPLDTDAPPFVPHTDVPGTFELGSGGFGGSSAGGTSGSGGSDALGAAGTGGAFGGAGAGGAANPPAPDAGLAGEGGVGGEPDLDAGTAPDASG